MTYPTKAEIQSIFGELGKIPSGYLSFFAHVDENVKWEITGQNALSGVWRSKTEFMNTVWLPIIQLIAEPGPILELVYAESMMTNEDGWTAIELKTTNTRTKLGDLIYSQHYCWHCKFNSTKKIVQVRAFIDSSTAETVLSDEKLRQEALKILPNHALDMAIVNPNYPMIPFDPAFKSFLNLFYLLTDAPSENEKYVQCFTPGALVVLGTKAIRGREGNLKKVQNFEIVNHSVGIHTLRNSMWDTIKQRTHRPEQVFPYGANSNMAMVYGTVGYVFKDDSIKTADWSARCDFVKIEDRVYLDRYQVYLADDVAWNSKGNP